MSSEILTHDMTVHNERVFDALKAAEQALANLGRNKDAAELQRLRWRAESILRSKLREAR